MSDDLHASDARYADRRYVFFRDCEDEDDPKFEDQRPDGDMAPVENEDFDPIVYYDPARFPHTDDLENLEGLIRARRPAGELRQWLRRPLNTDMLRKGAPFATARAEARFVARGYATKLECRDEATRDGGQTDQLRRAVDILNHATVVFRRCAGSPLWWP